MNGTKLSPFRYNRKHDSTAVFDHARAKRHIIFVFKNSDEGTVHPRIYTNRFRLNSYLF